MNRQDGTAPRDFAGSCRSRVSGGWLRLDISSKCSRRNWPIPSVCAMRIGCLVISVFEVTAPQPERLASAILGPEAAGQLQLLTPAVVLQLQLESTLPPSRSRPVPQAPELLGPGDRVFHLRLANDPTVTVPSRARPARAVTQNQHPRSFRQALGISDQSRGSALFELRRNVPWFVRRQTSAAAPRSGFPA